MAATMLMIPIYDYPVLLATDMKGASKVFYNAYQESISLNDAKGILKQASYEVSATVWVNEITNGDGDTVCGMMMVCNKRDTNTVAHEATHLAMKTLEFAGVEIDYDNHEALAYLVGYITEQFTKKWA